MLDIVNVQAVRRHRRLPAFLASLSLVLVVTGWLPQESWGREPLGSVVAKLPRVPEADLEALIGTMLLAAPGFDKDGALGPPQVFDVFVKLSNGSRDMSNMRYPFRLPQAGPYPASSNIDSVELLRSDVAKRLSPAVAPINYVSDPSFADISVIFNFHDFYKVGYIPPLDMAAWSPSGNRPQNFLRWSWWPLPTAAVFSQASSAAWYRVSKWSTSSKVVGGTISVIFPPSVMLQEIEAGQRLSAGETIEKILAKFEWPGSELRRSSQVPLLSVGELDGCGGEGESEKICADRLTDQCARNYWRTRSIDLILSSYSTFYGIEDSSATLGKLRPWRDSDPLDIVQTSDWIAMGLLPVDKFVRRWMTQRAMIEALRIRASPDFYLASDRSRREVAIHSILSVPGGRLTKIQDEIRQLLTDLGNCPLLKMLDSENR